MTKKAITPRSRRFDERTVVRGQDNFKGGMVRDKEAVDLGSTEVASLINARGHSSSVRGRKGSKLWLDLQLPSEATGIELTKASDTLTATTSVFLDEHLGYMVHIPDVAAKNGFYVLFITAITSPTEVVVSGTAPDATYTSVEINAPINATYCDKTTGAHYYLVGTKVYVVIGNTVSSVFTEYFVQGSQTVTSAESSFFRIGNNIVLVNPSGIFVLSDVTDDYGLYVYKANEGAPTANLASTSVKASTPSSYNYTYAYTRMGKTYVEDRNSSTAILERVSAPAIYSDERKNDLTTIEFPRPIVKSTKQDIKYKTSVVSTAKQFSTWVNLSDDELKPYAYFTYNGDAYRVFFDFSAITSMRDVAEEIEKQIQSIDSSLNFHFRNASDDLVFELYSTDVNKTISTAQDPVPQTEYDIMSEILTPLAAVTMKTDYVVESLEYPTDVNDVTHYSVYRSKDVWPSLQSSPDLDDDRIVNNPNTLGWVMDVPVCQFITGTIRSGSGNFSTPIGTYNDDIIGNTMTIIGESPGATFTIDNRLETADFGGTDAITGTATGWTPVTSQTVNGYIGADLLLDISSKIGTTVVMLDTTGLTSGELLFWEDGTYSTIKSVDSLTEVTTVDSVAISAGYALAHPTSRNFCDTITDVQQNGYLSVWALQTRFYETLPNVDVAGYNDGVLVGACKNITDFYYTTTDRFWELGVYRSLVQRNDKLEDGIRSIYTVNDLIVIMTQTETHTLNTKQATLVTTDFGESYIRLPDPVLVQKGIGATHWMKYAPGSKGDVVVLTAEPALRFFDGLKYSRNYAEGKVQLSELQRMNEYMILDYDALAGVHIWGRGSE